ncbi:MAG TPA: histidine phosphatase family protein [Bryobacteraceae bacterium]|nr:histidine phosphatase family protein [Bryobacteraceae bacterium]
MVSETASDMLIHLLRHGIAEDASGTMKDADRALTADGRKKLLGVLRAAKAAQVAPAVILTSSYLRAVQTAEVAAEVLGYEGELIRTKALEPGSSPEDVWEELRLYRQSSEVLVSGHEPLLSRTVAYLLGAPALQIDFKKGAMASILMEQFGAQPRGVLRWLLTAKLVSRSS